MSKQDRQGVRTPTDIERKYDLGQLSAARGLSAKQEESLNQMSQTLNQYMATTNAKIEELEEASKLPEDVLTQEDLTGAINTALSQAKDSGEFKGEDGDDGFSPTVAVTEIEGGHRVTITDAEGTETFDVMDGEGGAEANINDQAPTYTVAETEQELTSGEKISVAFGKIAKAVSSLISHLANKNNPHNVTFSQLQALKTKTTTGTTNTQGNVTMSLNPASYVPIAVKVVNTSDGTDYLATFFAKGNTWWAHTTNTNGNTVITSTDVTVTSYYFEL
jgi:hypothetical protein